MAVKTYFRRPCIKCGELYTPIGKFQKICQKCKDPSQNKDKLKIKYFKSKEDLDAIRHSETLSKWKILSNAYKIGKKIWGTKFTKSQLAFDMDLPMTTTLRCLALDKATKQSWKLLKQNKISASKLSMICYTKTKCLQDKIVKLVIEKNLSTYQIKSLNINNIKDLNIERLRIAVEKGFSRKDATVRSLENWIERGKLLLLVKSSILSYNKKEKIKEDLKILGLRIEKFIE